MRRASVLLSASIALWTPGSARAIDLLPVEHPSLAAMERAVAEQLDAARQRLEAAQQEGRPDDLAPAFGDLGELYLVYDLVSPAAACLENAWRLRPVEARWPHLLGSLYEHDRALAAARRWYQRAVAVDPGYLPSRLRLGRVLATAGEDGVARQTFLDVLDDAPAASPFAAAAQAGLGRLDLAAGDAAAAIRRLERALELQPQATALHYPLAQAYRASGDDERARQHLARRGEADVGFPDPLTAEVRSKATGVGAELVLARAALRRGDVAAAEARARRAVELDRRSALAHRSLGDVLARAGRLDEARQSLGEAVRLAPDDAEARGAHVSVLERLGRDAEIVEALSPVVAASPDLAPAHAALGAALARLGEEARAEGHLLRALALDAGDDASRAALARLYGRLGRFREAAEQQARVIESDASPEAHLLLATARILGGEIAAAIDGLESAVEIHPRDPRLADVLARVLATATDARLRDGARAVELATRAWESAPSPDTADTLAMALAENGRFDEAAALAERALAARTSDRGGAPEAVERSREWLASYRRREPVREPWKE